LNEKKLVFNDVIDSDDLQISFKPIVSIINRKNVGFESKNLGMLNENSIVSMKDIIENVDDKDQIIAIERKYREKTVEIYSNSIINTMDTLLFIDINLSVISDYVGSGLILNLIKRYKLKPENVVLNITGEKFKNVQAVKDFIIDYRSRGFLVSLSGIGSGFANLDKISFFEPDIIIISKNITNFIEEDYYKQEVFKSLVNLSKSIGALVIADGINSEERALTTMELGADMLTGDYFGEYNKFDQVSIKEITEKLDKIAFSYMMYMEDKINFEKSNHKKYEKIIKEIIKMLSLVNEEGFDIQLEELSQRYSEFECIYVLDYEGIQVTNTVTQYKNMLSHKALIFQPAKIKTDHSLKKYYYYLKNMALKKYITEAYISLATGNLCVTISEVFKTTNGKKYILCIDFNPNDMDIR
jgi:EAL domain-containing protein (putative c-di-GMP-specific phosphodiesterase class I)